MSAAAPEATLAAPVAELVKDGGFILLDKPRGPSSHQVTAWARDLLGVPRAGHAGTLDPNVSGLLWIGFGPALKLLPLVLEFPKCYVAVVTLHGPVPDAELDRILGEFLGPIYQTPPVRSAVRRVRRVRTIHRLERLDRVDDRVVLSVVADSGTYVRTLAVDLGDALGIGAHLEELRRTATGPFREESAVTLSVLSDAVSLAREGEETALRALLHPAIEVWGEFPSITLKDSAASALAHGANLASGGVADVPRTFAKGARVVLLTRRGELIGFGQALVDSTEMGRGRKGWVVDSERILADPTRFPPAWGDRRTPTGA